MRNIRGLIALAFSLLLAFIVATAVYRHISKPAPAPPPAAKVEKNPPRTFSQRIDKGMRAVTLKVDDVSSAAGQLNPGDRVDILAVTPIPGDVEGNVSRLLLSGVRIMELKNGEKSKRGKATASTVTLSVTPQEAAFLATADPAAALRLIARNPEDEDPTVQPATAFAADRGIGTYAAQPRDLKRLISPGMRAITLEVQPTDGVGGVFHPDDRVDIVVTCPWGNISMQEESTPGAAGVLRETHRNSRILLQNIRVIATSQSLSWEDDLNQSVRRITLEVTPADAEKLTVLADSKKGRSTLRIISRNQEDGTIAKTKGAELIDLLANQKPYLRVDMIRGEWRKDKTIYR